jgi:hypothetical protein
VPTMLINPRWHRRQSTDAQRQLFHVDPAHDLPPHVASDIAKTVERAMAHLTGVWTVAVRATPERERWRVEMRSPLGRHIWMCLGSADRLPAIIDAKIKRFVRVASTQYQIRMLCEASGSRSLNTSST